MLRDRGPSKRAVEEMIRRYTERVDVPALSLPDARTLLARRMSGFPPLAALFCHAWSGGNPRDLLRVAEACIDQRRAAGGSPAVPGVADRVLRADLAGRAEAARDEHPGDFGWSGLRTGLDAAPATYDRLPAPPGELGGLLLVAAHLSRHLASPPAPGTSVQAVETLAEARRAARDQSRDEVATILARLPEPGERTPQP
jgi:hypothetical protein